MKEGRIEEFLESLSRSLETVDPNELWPLNVPQVSTYIDAIYALEFYEQIQKAKKIKPLCEIAPLFKFPSRIRLIISGVDIPVGLKAARKFQPNKSLDIEKSLSFLEDLFDLLECFNRVDPFCLEGKEILLGEAEVKKIINEGKWFLAEEVGSKRVLRWGVDLYALCWSFYYAAWLPGGLQIHGIYPTSKGPLLIRDYFDLSPLDLCDLASEVPVRRIRMSLLFKNLTGKINFYNQPLFDQVLPDELIKIKIEVENKNVTDLEEFEKIVEVCKDITKRQIDFVNNLSPLDQVRKGAEIAWYLKKDLSLLVGDDFHSPDEVEENIKKFGDRFIKEFRELKKRSKSEWKKLYDVREELEYKV